MNIYRLEWAHHISAIALKTMDDNVFRESSFFLSQVGIKKCTLIKYHKFRQKRSEIYSTNRLFAKNGCKWLEILRILKTDSRLGHVHKSQKYVFGHISPLFVYFGPKLGIVVGSEK